MRRKIYICGDEATHVRYARALELAGAKPCFEGETSCDGLLLPGGGDVDPRRYGQENTSSRNVDAALDAREWEFLDGFLARKMPILGVCRGMQLMNVYFGGTLVQDAPHHAQIGGKDRYHTVFSARGLFRDLFGASCVVNSAHHQIIDRAGEGLTVAQRASDGAAEAIFHVSLPILGVQWHPERMPRIDGAPHLADGRLVYRAFLSLF